MQQKMQREGCNHGIMTHNSFKALGIKMFLRLSVPEGGGCICAHLYSVVCTYYMDAVSDPKRRAMSLVAYCNRKRTLLPSLLISLLCTESVSVWTF